MKFEVTYKKNKKGNTQALISGDGITVYVTLPGAGVWKEKCNWVKSYKEKFYEHTKEKQIVISMNDTKCLTLVEWSDLNAKIIEAWNELLDRMPKPLEEDVVFGYSNIGLSCNPKWISGFIISPKSFFEEKGHMPSSQDGKIFKNLQNLGFINAATNAWASEKPWKETKQILIDNGFEYRSEFKAY